MTSLVTSRIYYGWIVVGVVFTSMLLAAGIRSLQGPLVVPLESEFTWDRASIAVAVSINLLLFGLIGPWIGRMMDRYGPKPVMLVGLTVSGFSVLAITQVRELWQLWLVWGAGTGLGAGAATGVVVAAVASRWFTKRRGLVVGLLSASMSAGQLVFLPLVMGLIVFQGWRTAVTVVAAAVLLIAVPLVALLMKNDPAEVGQPIEGGAVGSTGTAGLPVEAPAIYANVSPFRTVDFWLLAGSYFVCGFTTLGLIGTHLIPHTIDHGIPEVTTASLLGLMGFMNFIGTTGAGWLSDRFDKRRLLATIYGLRGLSLLVLPFIIDVPSLSVFAVVYGLDWIATVPPTVGLCADLYGRQRVGSVYGWVFMAHQMGGAAAAYGGGVARVMLGDYGLAFFGAGVLAIIAMGLSLRVRRASDRGGAEVGAPVPA